jgi:UDP-glucose:(heptosyl)LPS alpha-1,3-glucosyltransferase
VHVIPLWINYFGLGVLGSRSKKMSPWRRLGRAFLALISPRLVTYLVLEFLRLRPTPHKLVLGVSGALSDDLREVFHLNTSQSKTLIPGVESGESWAQRPHTDALARELALGLLQTVSSAGKTSVEFEARHLTDSTLKSVAQRGLGLSSKPRHWLLWVGHDERKKGLSALMDAMLEMPTDMGLMLVGKAASKSQTQSWIAQRGLQSRVALLGVMEDVAPAYIACDVLVHPTLEDTFGMAVVEAMAWARAVVVSPEQYCGVAQEVVNEEHVLVLRDPKDPQDIAQKVLAALEDSTRLGVNALEWTRAHTWANQAQALEQHYQDLLQRCEVISP